MNLTVLVQTGGGQTFSSNGIKLSELKDKNKLLFDYFSAKGVEYVYSSDIQKLKEEFDDDDGKFSKKELKKMGLDIKRSDVKAVNHTLNEIAATELADDGSYPVKINESRTEVYSKDKQLKFAIELEGDNKVNYFDKDGNKTRSVEQNGNNTTTTYFSSGKPKTIIEEQKDFGVTTTEIVYNDNGTSNRVITYSGEKLLGKNGNKSHKLTYDDLKPAIQGLMSRVPENMKNDPDYRMAETLIRNAEAGKPLSAKPLDISFIALAKKMQLQGTNFMPNQFLRCPAGNVMITPDYSNSMWESDAKFNLPTTDNAGKPVNKDFYFYRDDTLYDKCYDFQDIVGEGGLITNNSTGNNRKGEINFEAQKLDANETYYFQTKGGEKIEVKVQDGKAYVQDKNGKNILLNDILNGRVKMP